MSTLDRLRAIANRAGRPTMAYSYENEHIEQRESLNWIAHYRCRRSSSPGLRAETKNSIFTRLGSR